MLTSLLELAAGPVIIPAALPMLAFTAGVLMLGGMAVAVMMSMSRARRALTLERREIELGLGPPVEEQPARA